MASSHRHVSKTSAVSTSPWERTDHRWHPTGRKPGRECLPSPRVQRIGSRHAVRCAAQGCPGFRYLGEANDHHPELVRADQRDRWPRGYGSTYQTVA
jgi:hypothetical protein